MQDAFTVVISCAGMGKRLEMSKTKALANIMGRPLISWQLDTLKWAKDIRVVVGYQSQDVIECVKQIRDDVIFVFNHQYETTGTAASLVQGAQGSNELILSLDGDLIVAPESLKSFIAQNKPLLGILPITSDEPSYATLDHSGQFVQAFGKTDTNAHAHVEWSGLCCLSKAQLAHSVDLNLDKGHVFQLVSPHLPMPAHPIIAREIDTPDDFERAEAFLQSHQHLWAAI